MTLVLYCCIWQPFIASCIELVNHQSFNAVSDLVLEVRFSVGIIRIRLRTISVIQQHFFAALAPDVDKSYEPPHAPCEAKTAQGPGVPQGISGRCVRVVDLARNDAADIGQSEQDPWEPKLTCARCLLHGVGEAFLPKLAARFPSGAQFADNHALKYMYSLDKGVQLVKS